MVALFRLLESSKQVGRYHAFLGYLPDEDEAPPRPASPPARESRIGWVYDPDTGQLHPPGTSIARRAIPPQRAPSLLRTGARLLVGAARALLRGEPRHDTPQRAHQERRSDPDDDPED